MYNSIEGNDQPLKVFDMSVTMKWDFEKAAEYQYHINNIVRFKQNLGRDLTIEYVDEYLNVIKTVKLKGEK